MREERMEFRATGLGSLLGGTHLVVKIRSSRLDELDFPISKWLGKQGCGYLPKAVAVMTAAETVPVRREEHWTTCPLMPLGLTFFFSSPLDTCRAGPGSAVGTVPASECMVSERGVQMMCGVWGFRPLSRCSSGEGCSLDR